VKKPLYLNKMGASENWIYPYKMEWDKNQISKKIWPLIVTKTLKIAPPARFTKPLMSVEGQVRSIIHL